ncbi:unnamed protein product [Cladocopium goreaui]|uniref:Uncharacterized protein n=1 Tax=Cladocopium goreaui TaxID=2562237 RepID=A0A9P1G9D9_9DINO|nr:unnamed protein product [Cladocopium goreaui]
MGGPEPLVSHLKLFSLEKAAFETLDSLDSPDPSRGGDEGPQMARRASGGQEHRAPVDLQQQQDVLQQQLLKLKEVRESGDVAEGHAPMERSLLSPPQLSPKASLPKSPLRRMSRDSSASQSPTSPLAKQTRPTLRGAGAKAGKVPTTPLNSPMASDEKAPAIFVSQVRSAKAAPLTGSGKVPRSATVPAVESAPTIFRDKGLASALSNVPNRSRMGIPPEEIIPLEEGCLRKLWPIGIAKLIKNGGRGCTSSSRQCIEMSRTMPSARAPRGALCGWVRGSWAALAMAGWWSRARRACVCRWAVHRVHPCWHLQSAQEMLWARPPWVIPAPDHCRDPPCQCQGATVRRRIPGSHP